MKKAIRLLSFIFVIFIIITLGFYVFRILTKASKLDLRQTIFSALAGAKGKYSVVVKDLQNGKTESVFGDKLYQVGSLYKLWIVAEALREIQNGTLSEDEVLSEGVGVLNNEFEIDTDSRELTDGTITLTVKDALTQMITISHNYAAMLITKRVKLSTVARFLENNGFKDSRVGGSGNIPASTADDITLFFEKLYKNELVTQQYTQKMLTLLKTQKLNDKLPKYLPEDTVVAHKTGEIGYFSHDAGIVYTENGDYIIVVLSESDYPPGAGERIAQISKAVFEYFSEINKNK